MRAIIAWPYPVTKKSDLASTFAFLASILTPRSRSRLIQPWGRILFRPGMNLIPPPPPFSPPLVLNERSFFVTPERRSRLRAWTVRIFRRRSQSRKLYGNGKSLEDPSSSSLGHGAWETAGVILASLRQTGKKSIRYCGGFSTRGGGADFRGRGGEVVRYDPRWTERTLRELGAFVSMWLDLEYGYRGCPRATRHSIRVAIVLRVINGGQIRVAGVVTEQITFNNY